MGQVTDMNNNVLKNTATKSLQPYEIEKSLLSPINQVSVYYSNYPLCL